MSKLSCIIIDHINSSDQYFLSEQYNIIALVTRDIEAARVKYGTFCEHFLSFKVTQNFEDNYKNNYNLTYADIENFRSTQLKIEHGLQRKFTDMGTIQQKYLNALAYWLEIFESHTVDAVILMGQNHSMPYDCIPIDIAVFKNIPTFNICTPLGYGSVSLVQIISLNQKKFIKINNSSKHLHNIHTFVNGLQEYYQKNLFKKKRIGFAHPYKFFFKKQVRNFPYFIADILKTPYQKYRQSFIKQPLLTRGEIFTSSIYVKNLKKLYDKISITPSLEQNYIYYSLHQEPEASIMATTTLNAQLFIIQWLSECLPKNWKLYIKEHPSTFFCYDTNDYFLKNIHYFRSPYFYKQIQLLPNTCLISIEMSSNILIQNAKAVASICGSALLESIMIHKPIIIFGENTLCLELLKDAFKINSKNSLQEAINKIGGYSPSYSDFDEVISNFTLLSNDINFKQKMKQIILNSIVQQINKDAN
ncbi:hypothetical protein [Helicobacter sp.]|uniref:hypothetical protein n=1 Tax=Helicobacter sp. TaxID=218 RepID=UPI001996270A|nr:hypothetical protein [Helicobacter sp.]MBD5165944.1 hypothetical protein [Helicobacter sp.]